jgi:hypothetical protein
MISWVLGVGISSPLVSHHWSTTRIEVILNEFEDLFLINGGSLKCLRARGSQGCKDGERREKGEKTEVAVRARAMAVTLEVKWRTLKEGDNALNPSG